MSSRYEPISSDEINEKNIQSPLQIYSAWKTRINILNGSSL